MKYFVTHEDQTIEIEIDGKSMRSGETTMAVNLLPGAVAGSATLVLDGRHYSIVSRLNPEGGKGAATIWVDGERIRLRVLDERAHHASLLEAAGASKRGPSRLLAPMPGLIVRLNVGVGAEVVAGESLLVMEAMKMENELRAPAAGRVKAIHIAAGQAVEKGAPLLDFE